MATFLTRIRRFVTRRFVDQHAKTLSFYQKFIGDKKKFFDIGAHIGNKTQFFLDIGVDVVAVEPQSLCFKQLKDRFINNNHVQLVNKGVGTNKGEMKLKICSDTVLSTFSDHWTDGRFKNYVYDKEETIEMTTLDDLIETYGMPDFCKIDVEGFEVSVLKGLNKKIPALNFEFTSEFFDHAVQCLNHLESLGFTQFNYARGEEPEFECKDWLNKEQFINEVKLSMKRVNDLWGDIYAR